jgi:hypothetical protein
MIESQVTPPIVNDSNSVSPATGLFGLTDLTFPQILLGLFVLIAIILIIIYLSRKRLALFLQKLRGKK